MPQFLNRPVRRHPQPVPDAPPPAGKLPPLSPAEATQFRAFAAGLQSGTNQAGQELLDRYSALMLAHARQLVGVRLAARADPEDLVQSALRTFFRQLGDGQIELRDWQSLAGLLVLQTLRKCQRQVARNTAQCRDLRREVSLHNRRPDGTLCMEIPDRSPTPEEIAMFNDLLAALRAQCDKREQTIMDGLLMGDHLATIAEHAGCSERSVQRAVVRLRQRLFATIDDQPAFSAEA